MANLFVDEARLSSNEFDYVIFEVDELNKIRENDLFYVQVPLTEEEDSTLINTEVYFFWLSYFH